MSDVLYKPRYLYDLRGKKYPTSEAEQFRVAVNSNAQLQEKMAQLFTEAESENQLLDDIVTLANNSGYSITVDAVRSTLEQFALSSQ